MPIDYARVAGGMADLVSQPSNSFIGAYNSAQQNARRNALTDQAAQRTNIEWQQQQDDRQNALMQQQQTQQEDQRKQQVLQTDAFMSAAQKDPRLIPQALGNLEQAGKLPQDLQGWQQRPIQALLDDITQKQAILRAENPQYFQQERAAELPTSVREYEYGLEHPDYAKSREKGGGTIRLPDGTVINTGGAPYGDVSLSKLTRGNLEQAFTNSQANAMALNQQLAKWRPEFSTYGGAIRAKAASTGEKVGVDISPEQRQYLDQYTSWKSDTAAALSAYLNQLSGAAISPAEEARLKSGFPNTDDGPTEYHSKVKATVGRFALAQARAAYLLSQPSMTLDSVSLDKMGSIIVTEANALAKSYESGGASAEDARQQALAATRAKYGIGGYGGQ